MTNLSSGYPRDAFDFYREPPAAVRQLMDAIDFGDDMIWDPCCGKGNVLDVAKARGHVTVGSDIIDRHPRHRFFRGNILLQRKWPSPGDRALSVITNPPYGYIKDIAEDIIWHILRTFPVRRAAFILPIEFLASQGRHELFTGEFRPSHSCVYSQRHTMPPGALEEAMGERAYKGGQKDFCAVVWTHPHRWRAESVWLRPDPD